MGSDACSPSPSPANGEEESIIIIISCLQSKNCTKKISYVYCEGIYFGAFLSNLSEVTLLNEDCACKWNHVAAPGLVGREVWYSYICLRWKRMTAGRFSAKTEYTGYYKSPGSSLMSNVCVFFCRPLSSQ